MTTLHLNWQNILDRHEGLLGEMLASVQEERTALMANDVDRLRETTLLKDKASRKLALLRDEIKALKTSSLIQLGMPAELDLDCLFATLGRDECRELQHKRNRLNTLTKTLRRQNDFNSDCLNVYLGHINGIRSILSLVYDRSATYNPSGMTNNSDKRSLINRSI